MQVVMTFLFLMTYSIAMREPRIVAVMPVSGREELFPLTIERLFQQEGVRMSVVAICDTPQEFVLARGAGAVPMLRMDKMPLGAKWQMGVEFASNQLPDAIMIVGSGNWFTNGWVKTLYPYLDEYDIVGSEAMYALHLREKDRIMIHWGGYHTNSRKGDMLGAGRLVSRRILDKADWKIYNPNLEQGLDRSMTKMLKRYGAKTLTLPQGDEMILKISSYKWKNINSFGVLWGSPNARRVERPGEILKYFPEITQLLV